MYFNTFISSKEDTLACSKARDLTEVLIEPSFSARDGKITIEEAIELAKLAREKGIASVMVWDIFMTNPTFKKVISSLEGIDLYVFSAIRVQCPGAAKWLIDNYPEINIHYIVENSNHNLEALIAWSSYFKPNLKRLILSIQLPKDKIINYCKSLPVDCEILGAGRILLFYSPRKLLSANFPISERIEILAESDESNNRSFPIIENNHGIFMYLNKDQFILDKIEELKESGLHTVRIDLRHLSSNGNSAEKIEKICALISKKDPSLKNYWKDKTTSPFFKTNKTTKQFSKLKSKTRELRDENCLAEIVSCEKGQAIAFFTLQDFDFEEEFTLILPNEKKRNCSFYEFRDLSGNKIVNCKANQIITTPWVRYASTGCLLQKKLAY